MNHHTEISALRHAVESGILAGLGIFVAALYAPRLGLAIWLLILVEITAGFVAVFWVLKVTESVSLAACLLGWGLTAGVWTLVSHYTGIWHSTVLAALGIPMLILTPWLAHAVNEVHKDREKNKPAGQKQIEGGEKESDIQFWQGVFARRGLSTVVIRKCTPTRAGKDLSLRLPSDGSITKATLDQAIDALESAANLRHGALRFSRGERAGEAILHITEKEVLKEVIPFPMELDFKSINEPFQIGVYESGEPAMVYFREVAALIVGARGAGKSNLINVLIASLAQCVDVVIFMIDMKGGRAAGPWLEAWIDGKTQKPVLDWVATTRDEVELMLDVLEAWRDNRSRYAGGKEKVTPSTDEPAIVLIVDEMAVVFGQGGGPSVSSNETTNARLAQKLKQLVNMSRSEAIDPILATQRGTVTMVGDGDLKSQCSLRFGLGTVSSQDARSIFPDNNVAAKRLAKLAGLKGVAIYEIEDDDPEAMKTYRLDADSDLIYQIAMQTGNYRPDVEERLRQVAGNAYTQRWEGDPNDPSVQRGQTFINQVRTRTLPEDDDATFEALTDQIVESINPARVEMRRLILEEGVLGLSPFGVRDKMEKMGVVDVPTRETINRWLSDDVRNRILDKRGQGAMVRYTKPSPGLHITGTDG